MPGRFPPPVRSIVPTFTAALALGVGGAPAQQPPPPCAPEAADQAAVVCEINVARAAAGRAPVRTHPALDAAAGGHARDMVARAFFSHDAPGGSNLAMRARRAGYLRGAKRWRVGETLLWRRGGPPLTAAAMVAMWLGSPGHRHVLLSPHYADVGVGIAPGAPYGDPAVGPAATVVADFGRRYATWTTAAPRSRPARRSSSASAVRASG